MRCSHCNKALTPIKCWMCALCNNHFLCETCEKRYTNEHPMTFIKSKMQLELFKLTTPLYSGRLVNRFDFKK